MDDLELATSAGSVVVAVAASIIAFRSLRTAQAARNIAASAEARQRRARLTIASCRPASDVTGYIVTVGNVGFASARHPEVTLIDRTGHAVGRTSVDTPVHPKDSISVQVKLDDPSPQYPLRIRIDWRPYADADDEGDTWIISKLLIEADAPKLTDDDPQTVERVWRDSEDVLPIEQATPGAVAQRLADPREDWSPGHCTPATWDQCLGAGKAAGILGEVTDASEWQSVVREEKLRVVSVDGRTIRWVRSHLATKVLASARHESLRCIDDPGRPFREGYVKITEDDEVKVYRNIAE